MTDPTRATGFPRGWTGPPPGAPPAPPRTVPPPGPPGWVPVTAPPSLAPQAAYDLRPGPVELRPLSFTDILDGSFALYRTGLRVIVPLVLAVMVPLQLLSAFLQRDALRLGLSGLLDDAATADLLLGDGMSGVGVVSGIVVQLLLTPVLAGALVLVAAAVRDGRMISPMTAVRGALRMAGWLIAASLVGLLVRCLLLLVAAAGAAAGADAVVAAGLVLGVPVALVLTPFVALVAPAIMAGDRPPVQAAIHAVQLVRGAYLRTTGVMLGTTVVFNLVAMLLAGIPNVIGVLAGLGFGWVLVALGSVVVQLIVAPLTAAAMVLLHTDLRVRQEGLDFDVVVDRLRPAAPRP